MFQLIARAQPAQLPGYPDFLAALLHARGIHSAQQAEQFLNPGLDQLNDPHRLHGVTLAVKLIKKAVQKGLSMVVYGDYDADGICASAILLTALKQMGAQAISYIPDRQQEGYGLNAEAVTQLSIQAKVLISVDCGITAAEETNLSKQLGMQVILTDHHALPDTLPLADAIVHPHLGDYPNPALCGAGVAFQLARALTGEMSQDSLALAALASVADLVPLQGENRALVSLGLQALEKTALPGLIALKEISGIQHQVPMTARQLAFQLAPRLNAGGRLSTARDALCLMMTNHQQEANQLAALLETLNQERRQVTAKVQKEAEAQADALDLANLRSLVVAGRGWNPGVVGLVAGKLAERWNYPTVVLTQREGEYTGSGRSVLGIDLHQALCQCSDLLIRFGGHTMAAGLSIKEENLEAFRRRFDQAIAAQLEGRDLVPRITYDCSLPLNEVHEENIALINRMAPFGQGNPSPSFLFEELNKEGARQMGKENDHLRLRVSGQGNQLDAVAFGQGFRMAALPDSLRLVGSVEENNFMGKTSLQLMVKHILPGKHALPDSLSITAKSLTKNLQAAATIRQEEKAAPLPSLPELTGFRGILLIAHTEDGANALYQAYPQLTVHIQKADDPRGFHAIVAAPDWSQPFTSFDTLVFADGLLHEQEVALAMKACQAKQAFQLPRSAQLHSLLSTIAPTREELRNAYISLRSGKPLCYDRFKNQACLLILSELDLIKLDENLDFSVMIPMKPIDPESSPLFVALRRM